MQKWCVQSIGRSDNIYTLCTKLLRIFQTSDISHTVCMYVCIIESIRTRVPFHATWTTSEGGVVAKWDCDDIATHARG